MGLKHNRVAVTADDPAADVKMSDWNADHVVDGDGVLLVADATTPSTPAAGFLNLHARLVAGYGLPAYVDESGLSSTLQPFFGRNKVGMWVTTGNFNTAAIAFGIAGPSNQGTLTLRTVASTNLFTSTRRLGVVSSASAGNYTGLRASAFQFLRGDAAGKGGFRFVIRWGCSDAATVSGARTFVGLSAATVGSIDPSTAVSMIGVGTDAADSTLVVMHNDGSGTATRIALGANFPDHTLSADAYELVLFCAPNTSTVGYQVTRLNTGDVASGTISTDLPASTTLLGPQLMRNNGATALAVGIDLVSLYIETDN